MAVSYGKGDKGKATKLHSQIIRKYTGHCENCGTEDYQKLTCAHIIGRKYSATRTDLRNAFSLCYSCHRRYTDWPREFSRFITTTWAQAYYDDLKDLTSGTTKMDWSARLVWLKDIEKQLANGLTLNEARELERQWDEA